MRVVDEKGEEAVPSIAVGGGTGSVGVGRGGIAAAG